MPKLLVLLIQDSAPTHTSSDRSTATRPEVPPKRFRTNNQPSPHGDPAITVAPASLASILGDGVLSRLRALYPTPTVVLLDVDQTPTAKRVPLCQSTISPRRFPDISSILTRLTGLLHVANLNGLPITRLPGPNTQPVPHAIARWVHTVLRAIDSETDPRTVADWARRAGVSRGAIRNWCRAARLSTKRSLALARMLRVLILDPCAERQLQDLLDITDSRSLKKFLKLGADIAAPYDRTTGIAQLLAQQRWITDPLALHELRAALQRRDSWIPASNQFRSRPD